jgi:hypothetical protein
VRPQRETIVGAVVVAAYLTLAAVVVVAEVTRSPTELPERAEAAADRFVVAWERARTGTFVVEGTVERSSEVTGARLTDAEVLAQRPPRRLLRAFGGVEGRDDDRRVLCPAGAGERTEPCRTGPPGGPGYEDSVAAEVDALADLVGGDDPVYDVVAHPDGCFDLALRRVEPRAPYGISATFCFDPTTGAPIGRRVAYEGGVEEVFTATEVRAEVTDADLDP